jgi:hypothetical protein
MDSDFNTDSDLNTNSDLQLKDFIKQQCSCHSGKYKNLRSNGSQQGALDMTKF